MEEPRHPLSFQRVQRFARDHGVSVEPSIFRKGYDVEAKDLEYKAFITSLADVTDFVVKCVRVRREAD